MDLGRKVTMGIVGCLGLLISVSACDGGAPTDTGMDGEVAAIVPSYAQSSSTGVNAVSPSSASITVGATVQLVAVDASGNPVTASWSTSSSAVATVSSSGLVKGVSAGSAAITAKTRKQSARATVTVTAPVTTSPTPTPTEPAPTPTEPTPTPTEPTAPTAPVVSGAFYVSSAGSDANAGTQSAPWRTLGAALTRLSAGQTLYVRGGTYVENIRNPAIQKGRADARVRVAAYPGERPVIQGLLWLTGADYWTLDGINVTWNTANAQTDHMVKMTNGVGWVFENAELWNARSFAGLLVYGSVTGQPSDWTVRGNCIHDIWTEPTHHVNGDHNIYVNTGITAGPGLIERNILFNAPNGQNIKLGYGRSDPQPGDGTANVTVRYNTMYSALKNLMVADETRNITIERNIVQGSREGYAIRAYRLTGTNNVFRNNVFFEMSRLQYGDSGYTLATDGGGNLFPRDPRFDAKTCSSFRPADTTVQSYGRWAP